ncbi:MAG: endo-1,4-beta-xylanase [Ignavibacteriae bacterium]|nr:endo-1,4-beta-xylanase [Ignavibacteriota bacterium]
MCNKLEYKLNNLKIKIFKIVLFLTIVVFNENIYSQLVTNGNFEVSDTGVVTGNEVKGWLIQVAESISPAPVFEIIDDTYQNGNKALKISIGAIATNQWDIQIVADSIPSENEKTYYYSIWAKAEKPGAQVNFTVGNYSYSEYAALRPANLTTEWKEFKLTFSVSDNQTIIRAPIHLNYAGNVGNVIYIDNLKIIAEDFGKTPIIVEAESGIVGSNFLTEQDGDITFVKTSKNYIGLSFPEDSNSVISYQVTVEDSGKYNLFAKVRVGSGTFNDDSFFAGKGFGDKNDTSANDWVFVNGLGSAGFSAVEDYVNDFGIAGSEVWKWINVTKNFFPVDSTQEYFYVSLDSLTNTFQIGSREDGLDFDKFAFGKANLFYTVNDLENTLPGSETMEGPDSSKFYQGPPYAEGMPKFLGNAYGDIQDNIFQNYWNQLTPGNAGKWGSVANSIDTLRWNWNGLDRAYNCAKDNNLIFKNHTLIWGQQQPSWISTLDSAQQIKYIETWIRKVGERYPDIDMIDVVNEPLVNHNPPDGINGRANYKKALGGNGVTGWDWVIKSFELARKYLPNSELILNDYGIINDNSATTSYLQIIKILNDRGLIDGIGVQGHRFELENTSTSTLKYNLDRLTATGLPIYISELDLGNIGDTGTPNDAKQLELYKKYFPVLWQHPGVKGITLWGYLEGQMWQTTCYLVHTDGEARPALDWLVQYIKDNPVGVEEDLSIIPDRFELEQNYPNPFNPITSINYNIAYTTKVSLKIFDILGREIQTLVNEVKSPGRYNISFNAQNISSGVYFYQLTAGNFSSIKKLIVLK